MRKIFTFFLALIACVGTMTAALPQGALKGLFTINAQGDKIAFSQGNLQATTTDLGVNWTWSFATNQYDYIGNAAANTAINGNGTVSSNGTIDLFGWSTAATTFGIHNTGDYTIYSGDFVDWGVNAITNGGNKANAWRTLTKDEWVYLFYTRESAATLFGLGSVNGVNGLILLPDNWGLPAGASFTPSTTQGLEDQGDFYKNSNSNNFEHNTYTAEQWSVMESAGAVFLPAAGFRQSTTVNDSYIGSYGYYWSASTNNTNNAYRLNFSSGFLRPQNNGTRDYGFSVRLVQDVVPAVGDTIRYEYKGNNLYYKILYKNSTYKTVGLVNDGTPGTYWTESNEPEGALVIPDSIEDWQGTKYAVTDIYEYAFRDCEKITSIDLSETQNISTVGRYSFGGCTAATSVTLSDKIKYIYSYAFYRMPLTSFDLKNVEELGQWIFLAGSNIETVNIPKTLRIIPDQTGLFEHATTITCDAENPNFKVVDNVLYNKDCTKLVALPTALSTAEIHIPTTVTTMLYQSMGGFEGTLYINSEIVSTWPPSSGDNRNSPKGDVFVGCHLLDFYTTGRYEGAAGDFGQVKSLTDTLLYSFSVSAGEHGSVQFISHGQCNVREISAFPDEHYEFVEWSNGSTEDHLDITVVSDTAISASFRAIQYDITFVDGLTDEVIEVKQGTFGSAVEAPTAPTHTGWVFTGWDNDDYLNIPGAITVTALYEVDTTGFEQIEQSPMGNCKFMKNGQLFIRRGDKIFNTQGARVE